MCDVFQALLGCVPNLVNVINMCDVFRAVLTPLYFVCVCVVILFHLNGMSVKTQACQVNCYSKGFQEAGGG